MKIAIICADTFPLTLSTNDKSVLRKCSNAGALGKRAYQFYLDICTDISVKYLCTEVAGFATEVDVYIPHYNYPDKSVEVMGPYFEDTLTSYISYNFNRGISLDKLCDYNSVSAPIKKYDYIYIQTATGVNFNTVSLIPYNIGTKVIVDNWVPFLQEQVVNLKRYDNKGKRKFKQFKYAYDNLLQRADSILFDNIYQLNYIEGYLQQMQGTLEGSKEFYQYKYDPFSVGNRKIYLHNKKIKPRKLLWYGPIYPWYDIDSILNFIISQNKYSLTFYGVRHPRYTSYYNTHIKYKLIPSSLVSHNINIIEDFMEEKDEDNLLASSDICVIFDNHQVENRYAVRVRILDLLAMGNIVVTNSRICGLELKDGLYYIDNVYAELHKLLESKLCFSEESYNKFIDYCVVNNVEDFIK